MEGGASSSTTMYATTIKDVDENCIVAIFSLLPTPTAIEACTFAREWRGLWHKVPVVSFDIMDAYWKAPSSQPLSVTRALFADRISRFFFVRDVEEPVREFRLVFHFADRGFRGDEVRSWVRSAAIRGAEKVDLGFRDYWQLGMYSRACPRWPRTATLRESMVNTAVSVVFRFSDIQNTGVRDLRLSKSHLNFDVLNSDTLHRLWLNDIRSVSDEDISNLISGCNNLREFNLSASNLKRKTGRIDIHSTTLEIVSWRMVFYDDEEPILSLQTPALLSLTLFGFHRETYVLYMPSLIEADVEFGDRYQNTCLALEVIVEHLYDVRRLRIQNMAIRRTRREIEGLVLHHYTYLKFLELLTGYHEKDILGFCQFLRASPLLEMLVLDYEYYKSALKGSIVWEDDAYYDYLGLSNWFVEKAIVLDIPNLKRVVMKNYRKTPNEAYVVELFKASGVALESIVAYPPKDGKVDSFKMLLWSADGKVG